jgi:hypothetical protein
MLDEIIDYVKFLQLQVKASIDHEMLRETAIYVHDLMCCCEL